MEIVGRYEHGNVVNCVNEEARQLAAGVLGSAVQVVMQVACAVRWDLCEIFRRDRFAGGLSTIERAARLLISY